MKPWIEELRCLATIMLTTSTPWIMGLMVVSGVIGFALVFDKLADYMNFHAASPIRTLLVLFVTVALVAAATIGARLYLTPRFGPWPARLAPLLGFLAAGLAPWALTRARYLHGLVALIIGLAAAAGIMTMTRAAIHAVLAGGSSVDRWMDRREETRDYMRE